MSISFPLANPWADATLRRPTGLVIRQHKVVGVSTSPGSLVQQVYEWPGERWVGEFTLPPMERPQGMRWATLLMSLRGSVGSFLLGDPLATEPMGAAAALPGTPQADGAHAARARVLNIKTGLGAIGNWVKAGSYFSVGTTTDRRLHIVLRDASLNSSGKAALEIWPGLRTAGVGDEPIYFSNPTGKFMLTSEVEYRADVNGHYRSATVGFVEDLRA